MENNMTNEEKQQYTYEYAKCADVVNSCRTVDQLISAGNFIWLFYEKWDNKADDATKRWSALDRLRILKLDKVSRDNGCYIK